MPEESFRIEWVFFSAGDWKSNAKIMISQLTTPNAPNDTVYQMNAAFVVRYDWTNNNAKTTRLLTKL